MLLSRSILLILSLVFAGTIVAQKREKMDFMLQAYLSWDHAPDAEVDLYIHGPAEGVANAVRAEGGRVKMSMDKLVSVRMPVDRVRALAQYPAVQSFEFSFEKGQLMNDSMRVKNHINEIQQGLFPLAQGYDGEGVIMGIIDSGMDWQHPDLRDENGNTRVLKYWDQTLAVNGQTPQPYGYGQVWDSTQINAGLMTSVDQPQYYGHGTTVTGTAAGNGLANGRHKGVAPRSDMIIVSSRFSGNFRASVADAVKFIFDEAAALGRPVVINASLGTYLGSHDGKDASALFIDQMLEERGGRVMVAAAGNSNAFTPYHLRTEVGADTTFTWFLRNNGSAFGYPAAFMEVWADVADLQNVQYSVGADRVAPLIYRGRTPFHNIADNLGTVITDTLRSFSGNRLGVVQYFAAQRGDQYQLQVLIAQPDSGNAVRFRFNTTGSGAFDCWGSAQHGLSNLLSTDLPSVQAFPAMVNYVIPDNDQHIVDSWACSPKVVAVANYFNETSYINSLGDQLTIPGTEGDMTLTSSKGPARNGLQKPDVAASGDITFSAAPLDWIATLVGSNDPRLAEGGMHLRNGGTSMASPVVAGLAALYLQRCPNAPYGEVIAAIHATARGDGFTGAVPNKSWGYGKLDGFAALVTSTQAELSGPEGYCANGSALVEGPVGMDSYTWSSGSTQPSISVNNGSPFSLMVESASGCTAWSDTVQLVEFPLPLLPQITVFGNELSSTVATSYQWSLNGMPVEGATDQMLVAPASGEYTVTISDANGCEATSDPVQVIITGVDGIGSDGFALWPTIAQDGITVRVPASGSNTAHITVLDAAGREVMQRTVAPGTSYRLSISALAPGVYHLQVKDGSAAYSERFVKQR